VGGQGFEGREEGEGMVVEGGVLLEPSHAYIPKSDIPGLCFKPATFSVLGVRFTDASEKNGCRFVAIMPLRYKS
jgi:hypothetical protein